MQQQVESFLVFLAQERRLSANTVSAYRNDLAQLVRYLQSPRAASFAPSETPGPTGRPVAREQVADFVLELRERGYAPATIARKIAAMRSLFHHLSQHGALAEDPTANLGAPIVRKPLPRALTVRDVAQLLGRVEQRDGADGSRDRAMLHLLYSTGMRVTELVSLDVTDVDMQGNQVRCVGRGGRERSIPVEANARRALVEYLERGRGALLRAGQPHLALFLNQRGDRLTRQGFWLIMKALARESGVSAPVTPHTLRHSFAAHSLGDGVALERLRELLGHANISTTQVYTQVRLAALRQETGADAAALTLTPAGSS